MTDTPDDIDDADQQLDESRLRRLGNTIRAERARQRLRQKDLAKKAGVHEQTIIKIENGSTDTSVLTIWHIADALGLTFTDLFQ